MAYTEKIDTNPVTSEPDTWILGLPTSITVSNTSGQTLRSRTASYDDETGHLLYLEVDTGAGLARTDFTYTNYGMLFKVDFPEPAPGAPRQSLQYTYDTVTERYTTEVKDAFDLTSETTYDFGFGLPLVTTDANDSSLTRTYDEFGRLTSVRGPYDVGTEPALKLEYPPLGSGDYPHATTLHQAYDASGNPVGSPIKTVTVVDGMGRAIEVSKTAVVEGVLGMTIQGPPSYDALGRVEKSFQPFFRAGINGSMLLLVGTLDAAPATEFTYDVKDRVTLTRYPDLTTETVSYALAEVPGSGSGILMFKSTHLDPEGHQRDSYADGQGRMVAYVEYPEPSSPATTRYDYLLTGELSSLTDPGGNRTTFDYDKRGLRTFTDNPDTGKIVLEYDLAGNLVAYFDANQLEVQGPGIQYTYDKGRLEGTTYPSKPEVTYSYGSDQAPLGERGRLLSVHDETGAQAYFYGEMGEVVRTERTVEFEGEPAQPSITFYTRMGYDSLGRQLSLTYPDGEKVVYSYDEAGQLSSVEGHGQGTPWTYLSELQYDVFGNRTRAKFGNGIVSTWSYDPTMVRLSGKQTITSGGVKLQDLSYTYDDDGNPDYIESLLPIPDTSEEGIPGPGSWKFGYDNVDRLVYADGGQTVAPGETTDYVQNFYYDAIHNLTQKTRTHQPLPNEPAKEIDLEYTYDPACPHFPERVGDMVLTPDHAGNITEIRDTSTGDTKTLIWDDDGRLAETTSELGQVRNYYDANGLRVLKRSDKFGDNIFASQYFDLRLNTEEPGQEKLGTKHIFAGGMRVASVPAQYDLESDGTTPPEESKAYYFHGDHLGSSNLITNSDGDVHEHLEYFPDGELWFEQKPGDDIVNNYRFSGKFLDVETGFYDFGQRFYDPKTGIWLSTDPLFTDTPGAAVGRPMVMSLYGYAAHSPILFVDPDGREPKKSWLRGGRTTGPYGVEEPSLYDRLLWQALASGSFLKWAFRDKPNAAKFMANYL